MYKLVEIIGTYAGAVTWWSLAILIGSILLLHTVVKLRYSQKLKPVVFGLYTSACPVCVVFIIWSSFTLLCGMSIVGKDQLWMLATAALLIGSGFLTATVVLFRMKRDVLCLLVYFGILEACGLTTFFHLYTNFPMVASFLAD